MNHRLLPFLLAAALPAPLAAQANAVTVQAPGLESLELGGQLRTRWETRDPSPALAGADAMSRGSGRFRLYADAAFAGGSGRLELQQTVDEDGTDATGYLRQGYFDLDDLYGMDVQVGRFAMKYGNQRMISDLDWSMVGRAWDGLRVSREGKSYSADLFWTRAVQGMAAKTGEEETFGGAYVEFAAGPVGIDAYLLARRNDATMYNDLTLGTLLDGTAGPVRWSAEVAVQSGDHGTDDAAGMALALRGDLDVTDAWTTGLGYELASGDDDPADGDDEAFRPLYDFGHAYHGHQDLFGWSNLQDIVWRNSFKGLCEDWTLYADLHLLAMAEDGGALPTTFGTQVAGEDDLGTELDVYAKGRLNPWLSVWTGVSFWSAGDAVAGADDQTWFFIDLVAEF